MTSGPNRRVRVIAIAVVVATAVALVIEGVAGVVIGLVAGGVGYRWLSRQRSREEVAEDQRVATDLPFAADLLAAALRAGAAPDVAARCTGKALGGPLGERLLRVDRALRLGAPADEAWGYLGIATGAGEAPREPVDGVRRLVHAAVRSQHSGAAFAGSLQRVADDLRADRLIAADAAGRRAGVLIVLPLGLCFLPAFVLAGLVPVIVAVLGDVLSP
jgi:pilus assembly protein TadC